MTGKAGIKQKDSIINVGVIFGKVIRGFAVGETTTDGCRKRFSSKQSFCGRT